MNYDRTAQNHKTATGSFVHNCFYFVLRERLAGRSVQSYKERSFFSVFSRLVSYPQVSAQVKKWLILGLREMIRVPHVVSCPIDLNFLCDQGQEGGVLNPTKNDHFQVFLAI